MMERLLKNNTLVKLFAFFLAVMLWVYVTGDTMLPDVTRQFRNVPLAWHNLDDRLELMEIPAEIDVVISGREDIIEGITPQNLKAFVNLRGLSEGTHRLTPNAEVPRGVRVISFSPQQITVRLEEVESPQMPVSLKTVGSPADGLVMGEPRIMPNSVFVRGPRSFLALVDRVQAVVDVSGATGDRTQVVTVEAVDIAGRPVEGVKLNPARVEVTVPLSEPQKTVPVRVPLEGSPAPGYQIRQVNLNPSTVTIRGSEEILAAIDEILTAPVSIEGASANIETELPLVAPENTTLLFQDLVQIQIIIVEQ